MLVLARPALFEAAGGDALRVVSHAQRRGNRSGARGRGETRAGLGSMSYDGVSPWILNSRTALNSDLLRVDQGATPRSLSPRPVFSFVSLLHPLAKKKEPGRALMRRRSSCSQGPRGSRCIRRRGCTEEKGGRGSRGGDGKEDGATNRRLSHTQPSHRSARLARAYTPVRPPFSMRPMARARRHLRDRLDDGGAAAGPCCPSPLLPRTHASSRLIVHPASGVGLSRASFRPWVGCNGGVPGPRRESPLSPLLCPDPSHSPPLFSLLGWRGRERRHGRSARLPGSRGRRSAPPRALWSVLVKGGGGGGGGGFSPLFLSPSAPGSGSRGSGTPAPLHPRQAEVGVGEEKTQRRASSRSWR